MIAIVRITGQLDLENQIVETFNRLNLRKKFNCIVIRNTPETLGMLKLIENFVAYGEIDKKTFEELVKKRGKALGKKKVDFDFIIREFSEGKINKKFSELGLRDYFALHPPLKGLKSSKKHFPKGVLGNNKEKINDLIRRML